MTAVGLFVYEWYEASISYVGLKDVEKAEKLMMRNHNAFVGMFASSKLHTHTH